MTIPFMYTACASQNQSLTQSVINQVLALHSQHISRRVADPCSKALASPATGLKNFRGLEEALMTVGGFGLRGITNRLTCYLPGRKSGLGWLTQGKIAKFSEDQNCHKNMHGLFTTWAASPTPPYYHNVS